MNETDFLKKLDLMKKHQCEFMEIGAFNTAIVPTHIILKQIEHLPDRVSSVLCLSDYGEYVSHLKHKYDNDCKVYCCPTTLQGYQMCIDALSVYEDNPSEFVIFNKERYSSFNIEYFEDTLKERDVQFDIEVGNPPYEGSLHLDVIETLIGFLKPNGVGIFIHPSGWLYNKYKLSKHFKVIEYLNQEMTDEMFGIHIQTGVIISKFSDFYKEDEFNELYTKYYGKIDNSEIDYLKSIKEIVTKKGKYDNWNNHIISCDVSTQEECVTVSKIIGGSGGRSMKIQSDKVCTFVLKYGVVIDGNSHIGDYFNDFTKSKNINTCLCIPKFSQKIYDYSKESKTFKLQDILFRYMQYPKYSKYLWMDNWTDDEWYDFFGLNDERKEIERIIDKIIENEKK